MAHYDGYSGGRGVRCAHRGFRSVNIARLDEIIESQDPHLIIPLSPPISHSLHDTPEGKDSKACLLPCERKPACMRIHKAKQPAYAITSQKLLDTPIIGSKYRVVVQNAMNAYGLLVPPSPMTGSAVRFSNPLNEVSHRQRVLYIIRSPLSAKCCGLTIYRP